MRRRLALVLLSTMVHAVALANDPRSISGEDGLALDALPEVSVAIPSDPTEFAPLNARPVLPTPVVPEITVAIPVETPVAPAETPPAPAIASAPAPEFADPDSLPTPVDPNAAIAMMPERPKTVEPLPPLPAPPPAAPVAEPPKAAASAPAPTPPALAETDLRDGLDRAFTALSASAALPQPVIAGLKAHYQKRDGKPLFTGQGQWLHLAAPVLGLVERAPEHGLDPRRFARLQPLLASPDPAMREIGAAATAVLYARDARGARINPRQVAALITATPTIPEVSDILDALESAGQPAEALEGYNPRHPGYQALKRRLAEVRGNDQTASTPPKLTFGPLLTLGMNDARVPLLREKLGLPPATDMTFDAELVNAVKAAQREHGLKPTGRLDRRIVAALGGVAEDPGPASLTAEIVANMESWRWLPVELGATHVMVNVPAFWLTMRQNGAPIFETRVVVGKPNTPTPIFSHKMEFLVVNPSWNVPPSIAMKEYLPLLQKNPYALQGRGLQVSYRGRAVDPGTIDWATAGRAISIRQPPGERNALGHIKFMFPNEHAVYLHDTPSRGLFANAYRAYSHGCVRVQNPFKLAEMVLGQTWSEGRLRGMVGGGERTINLNNDVSVHIAYFTLEAGADGALVRHADLYGHQRRLRGLLGL